MNPIDERKNTRNHGCRSRRGRVTTVTAIVAIALILAGCPNPTGGGGGDNGQVAGGAPAAVQPVFTPGEGTFSQDITVAIASETTAATIYYTLDGAEPTTSSRPFDPASPIVVAGDGTAMRIRAVAVAPGFEQSPVAESSYTIDYGRMSTPQFNPAPGTYDTDTSVSISALTAGATIHYTTDGNDPTSASPEFDPASPIAVAGNSTTVTIKALAVAPGLDNSAIAEGTFTIAYAPAATPTITEPPEPWVSGRRWWVESSPGATIYYTTNGTAPLDGAGNPTGSAQLYDPTLGVQLFTPGTSPTTYTIRAAAVGGGFLPSPEFTASYEVIPGAVVVNNGRDAGSLREAINNAQDGWTIGFGADYEIYSGAIAPPGGRIPFEYTVSRDITIDGGGREITINPGLGARGFVIGANRTVTIRNLRIHDGYPGGTDGSAPGGGAIFVGSGANVTIENVHFETNSPTGVNVSDYSGGAIYNDGGMIAVRNSLFTGNRADGSGGAIANVSGTITVRDSRFVGNFSQGALSPAGTHGGGAVWAAPGTTTTIVNSLFAGNEALTPDWDRSGGALRAGGTVTIHGSLFVANEVDGAGGAIDVLLAGDVTISNSVFANNISRSAFDPTAVNVEVDGATFGKIEFLGVSFINDYSEVSIAMRNSAASAYPGTRFSVVGGAEVTHTLGARDLSGNLLAGAGNLGLAAVFVSEPGPGPNGHWGDDDDDWGDLRLVVGSPGIDSGDNGAVAVDSVDVDEDGNTTELSPDYAGNARVQGGTVDMGAAER